MTDRDHQSADFHLEETTIEETDLDRPQDEMIAGVRGRHTIAVGLHREQDRLFHEDQDHHLMDQEDQYVNALLAPTVEAIAQVDQAMAQLLQIGDVCYHNCLKTGCHYDRYHSGCHVFQETNEHS